MLKSVFVACLIAQNFVLYCIVVFLCFFGESDQERL